MNFEKQIQFLPFIYIHSVFYLQGEPGVDGAKGEQVINYS